MTSGKETEMKRTLVQILTDFLIIPVLKVAFWVALLTIIVMPIIYLYGSQQIHAIDNHPLYDVFYTEPYIKLSKLLDRHQHVLLYGDGNHTGEIEHFLIHYANKKTEAGTQVVLTDLTSKDDMQLESILSRIRNFYEDHLNIVKEEPTIWILVTEDNQIPEKQFQQLQQRYRKDKFIIVTDQKVQFKSNFKRFAFPSIDVAEFKDQIMHSFDVDLKTADILLKYYESIPDLIDNIETTQFSPESLLGEDYHSANNLTAQDKKILYELCTNGRSNNNQLSETLQEFGTIFFEGNYYWVNHPSRLNYELHSGLTCKPSLMSRKLKKKMIERQQEARRIAEQESRKLKQLQEKRRLEAEQKEEKLKKKILES